MKGLLSKVTAVLSAAVMSVTVLGGALNVHAYDDYGLQEEETADVETDYSFGSTNSLGKIFSNEISEKNAAADISVKAASPQRACNSHESGLVDTELICPLFNDSL